MLSVARRYELPDPSDYDIDPATRLLLAVADILGTYIRRVAVIHLYI